jgi:hypothetical protein
MKANKLLNSIDCESSATGRRQTLPELNTSPYAVIDEPTTNTNILDNRRKNSMPQNVTATATEGVSARHRYELKRI